MKVLFLQLYAAHLIAAFVLPAAWASDLASVGGRLRAATVRIAVALAAVNLGLDARVCVALALLGLAQVGLDRLLSRSGGSWPAWAAGQVGHVLAVAACAGSLRSGEVASLLEGARQAASAPQLYFYVAAYVGAVFAGGAFVQQVTRHFMERVAPELTALKPGLPSAGRYIGWLERTLILTLVLAGATEAVGFLLATKALVRYPEIKDDDKGHFAEYFLVGTLTSVGLALLVGLLCRQVFPLL